MPKKKSDPVCRRINEYRRLRAAGSGGTTRRCEIVEDDLYPYDDPRIKDFLLDVATDVGDYDLARIAALKILGWKREDWALGPKQHAGVTARILRIFELDEDALVRNFAGQALAWHAKEPGVFEVAAAVVLDRQADLNLRHVAFNIVQGCLPGKEAQDVIRCLQRDTDFRPSAERILRERGLR